MNSRGMPEPWIYGAIYTSNIVIFFACTIMAALMLWTFFHKKDVPYSLFSFLLFVFYNLFNGLTRLTEILFFHKDAYELHAITKALCAIISSAAAWALWYSNKKAEKFPGVASMEQRLEAEVAKRQRAEDLVLPYMELLSEQVRQPKKKRNKKET